MKEFKLSVHEFALPSPLTGSLEAGGHTFALEKGQELHQLIQRKRKAANSDYRAEVKITRSFERDGYRFVVEGRMDGLFERDEPLIEEIKTSFNVHHLLEELKTDLFDHPYGLQLLSYGYFYWLNHNKMPQLSFHLRSNRQKEAYDLGVELDLAAYEVWLDLRLAELVAEVRRSERRVARRKKLASSLVFPFDKPRQGQAELIKRVEVGLQEKKKLLLQAPTGLGKTLGVLYPSLKNALVRGQKVIYVTPKNSQQSIAEEAIDKIQEKGCAVKSLTLTAKSKICLKEEPLCHPQHCEFARDYYDKVSAHDIKGILFKKKKLTSQVMKNLGKNYEVCPYELQLEAVEEADVVIGDYNHVFSMHSTLGRREKKFLSLDGKPELLIDEAHNLPARAMAYFSPALERFHLERFKDELVFLPSKLRQKGLSLLEECVCTLSATGAEASASQVFTKLDPAPFVRLQEKLKSLLLEHIEIAEVKARDPISRLYFYWSEFTEILALVIEESRKEFFISFQRNRGNEILKITCCDPSEFVKEKYGEYENIVAFSATLKPFAYYAQLLGLKGEEVACDEFVSPFQRENRKVLVIPQVSTKFSQRQRSYGRVAEVIEKIVTLKRGNYVAFFPSFDFLEETFKLLHLPEEYKCLRQERSMSVSQVKEVLASLKSQEQSHLLLAVQGGIFSEGIDYPGEMLIGAFVIGPPLPNFDFEREELKRYYQEQYRQGFEYAYVYPAMAKAIQAAGRVIRTERDRGIIVLLDDRFLTESFSHAMPKDWFQEKPLELISSSILGDIAAFWTQDHDNGIKHRTSAPDVAHVK